MATPRREDTVAEHAGKDNTVERRTPITPPLTSSDEDHTGSAGVRDAIQAVSQSREMDPRHMIGIPLSAEERTTTPNSEQTSSLESSRTPSLSELVQSHLQPQFRSTDTDTVSSQNEDYFASKMPATSEVADFAAPVPVPSSADHPPSLRGSPTARDSPTSASPDSHPLIWKDVSAQQQAGHPYSNYKNARPTSVPNFQTKPTSRRREGPEYPNYPDQSFKALQSQHYPPPYQPSSPHPLRTRSSHLSQNSSSSSDNQSLSDLPHLPSGAKTVGNTPAQSPGLFSPIFPVKKQWPSESDDGRFGTPTLHPSHYKPPKE